jgi:hypothetical protein
LLPDVVTSTPSGSTPCCSRAGVKERLPAAAFDRRRCIGLNAQEIWILCPTYACLSKGATGKQRETTHTEHKFINCRS